MGRPASGSAKVFVRVGSGAACFHLFSIKNAPGHAKHRHLELLGGNVEGEPPAEALRRELLEEDRSGILAGKVAGGQARAVHTVRVAGAVQHLFCLDLSLEECGGLEPNPAESLGFILIPIGQLLTKASAALLTRKTRAILAEPSVRATLLEPAGRA